ncbi:hypothetical protein KSP39_PZI004941 [Platanthera zijinensis]|uniref:BED-type domain-containing protein n=1 Tax=Platanthera zijinensis TaxID=2320716 RepID=A0AAP0BTN2_9ASPA
MVWEHFTVEAVAGGCTRACCKLCKQTFAYSTGSKIAGTSHLKRHIALGSCPKIKSQDRKQLALASGLKTDDGDSPDPPKRRYRTSSYLNSQFDQDICNENLAKMIILHELPLHMAEHLSFLGFAQSLQPRFRMLTSEAIEMEIMAVYQRERHFLLQVFGSMVGRISLTIGLWTTSQTLMVSSPHSENALSEVIGISLSEWNIKDKLFTITLDNNCSSHDIYSANLRDHLSNKNTLMLKGQIFVVRCYANILNVLAQDVIASIHGIIYNIRESVKFVKASPTREEKFAEISLQLEIPSAKTLSLDITTQWNTTYHMLVAALDYKQAFTVLETCDDNYNEAPSPDDWRKVEVVCAFLKLLFDSAAVIMAASFSKIYGEEAGRYVKVVNDSVHELYLEYLAQPLALTPAYPELGESIEGGGAAGARSPAGLAGAVDGLHDFDIYLSEMSSIFGTGTGTGTGGRVLDEYRSSLRPDIVEALFCGKDWLQYLPTMMEAPPSNAIVKMEL